MMNFIFFNCIIEYNVVKVLNIDDVERKDRNYNAGSVPNAASVWNVAKQMHFGTTNVYLTT